MCVNYTTACTHWMYLHVTNTGLRMVWWNRNMWPKLCVIDYTDVELWLNAILYEAPIQNFIQIEHKMWQVLVLVWSVRNSLPFSTVVCTLCTHNFIPSLGNKSQLDNILLMTFNNVWNWQHCFSRNSGAAQQHFVGMFSSENRPLW
jgi:hypothetical protein